MPSCGQCGTSASKSCARCHSVFYCSKECQKANWKSHKTACGGKTDEPLLPRNFNPRNSLWCLNCGRHPIRCGCANPGETTELVFVMDPIPEHFTVEERIRRWAELVSMHPRASRFDAKKFVEDLPKSFLDDLIKAKPKVTEYTVATSYKVMYKAVRDMGMPVTAQATRELTQSVEETLGNIFGGNWGYLNFLELRIFDMSVDHIKEDDVRDSVKNVIGACAAILNGYRGTGLSNPEWRLEDVKNISYD